ncbi:MAG: hypothetical protein ABIA76_03710 [Candidatus Diapherotrites archaeon]
MKNKGQVSIEWIVSFLFVLIIALSIPSQGKVSFENGILAQKMHDLLIVWAEEKQNSLNEMQKDFELFFGKGKAVIEAESNGIKEKIELNHEMQEMKEKIIEEIIYYDSRKARQKITLTVFH